MIEKRMVVGGHTFRTSNDYKMALHDQKLIDSLEKTYNLQDLEDVDKLYKEISQERIEFYSVLGREFDDKIYEIRKNLREEKTFENNISKSRWNKKTTRNTTKSNHIVADRRGKNIREASLPNPGKTHLIQKKKEQQKNDKITRLEDYDTDMQKAILEELNARQKKRKILLVICSIVGACCIGLFIYDMNNADSSNNLYEDLAELKTPFHIAEGYQGGKYVHVTKTTKSTDKPNVLTQYEELYGKNKDMIGWLKIDDTSIDYPVMQTQDDEYYLKHNFEKKDDKNGCIFLDSQCDVVNRSTNLILYGHHMQSGNMFGNLYKYQNAAYGKEHSTIQFDTIFEKGTYQVMYVFRSRVYSEVDVSFKYYQFINAQSSKEFNSYMNEMAAISFYDTGVTASYGDELLTLSTCDYQENGGRFVVVCKRVK